MITQRNEVASPSQETIGRLDGRVALVTGASSGIGEATALAFARQGAAVALAARRTDRVEALVERIRDRDGVAIAMNTDVADQEQAREAVERTVAELGHLDTLVNNAGVMLLGPMVDAPVEEWERMVHVNLLGLLYSSHAALPHLLRAAKDGPRGVADLVNISSVAGRVPRSGSGVYNATKHGVGGACLLLTVEGGSVCREREVPLLGGRIQPALVGVPEPGALLAPIDIHLHQPIDHVGWNLWADRRPLRARESR
jgi:NADP-dependent 3-hydroxy acid dehydrogenase YdfG